jgi:hypothetical protein
MSCSSSLPGHGRTRKFASVTLDAFKADTELTGSCPRCATSRQAPRELRVDARSQVPFAPLDAFLRDFDGRVLLTADSAGRREVLQDMLRTAQHEVTLVHGWNAFAQGEARLAITVAPDLEGLTLTRPAIAVISEAQLFGARARQERRRKRAADPEAILRDLRDLNPGAPVVHEEYGVNTWTGNGDRRRGVPGPRYWDGTTSTCRAQALHLVPLHKAAPKCPAAAQLQAVGARAPRQIATSPRNCSTCTRRKARQARLR